MEDSEITWSWLIMLNRARHQSRPNASRSMGFEDSRVLLVLQPCHRAGLVRFPLGGNTHHGIGSP